jgi:hypothetical protein
MPLTIVPGGTQTIVPPTFAVLTIFSVVDGHHRWALGPLR